MKCDKCCGGHGSASDGLYGIGVVGAAVYFVQSAVGFWPIVIAVVKAFFWPAFVVFKVLSTLGI